MQRNTKRKQLNFQVEEILKAFPKSRDDDQWLTIKIWVIFHEKQIQTDGTNGKKLVYLDDIMGLPREDGAKRIRAHFQNVLGKYLPTTWEVARKRQIKEEEWRAYVKGGFNN